eukprot:14807555-Heterocapsa_arctica.AAC.1
MRRGAEGEGRGGVEIGNLLHIMPQLHAAPSMNDLLKQRVALEHLHAASAGRAKAGGSASICLGSSKRRGRRLRLDLPKSAAAPCLRGQGGRGPKVAESGNR